MWAHFISQEGREAGGRMPPSKSSGAKRLYLVNKGEFAGL